MLLDTCVVSELTRPAPDPVVLRWMSAASDDRLHLSVLTIGEIRKGTQRLPAGKKRQQLEAWAQRLQGEFAGRILPIDAAIALVWGEITAEAQRRGQTLPATDGLIAATAIRHGMPLVTRNVDDFRSVKVEIENPWARAKR